MRTSNTIEITAFELAQRFLHTKEIPGNVDNPQVMAMLKLDATWPEHDEVPWCSAFVNYICWMLKLPRSKSLRARTWLLEGWAIEPDALETGTLPPEVGFDVVILKRGGGDQPGPEVIEAQGHVGFFGGFIGSHVRVLGGNQSNTVSIADYPINRILGIRRLYG